jgi:parvulin-like peptidyl-prolyl isomerase
MNNFTKEVLIEKLTELQQEFTITNFKLEEQEKKNKELQETNEKLKSTFEEELKSKQIELQTAIEVKDQAIKNEHEIRNKNDDRDSKIKILESENKELKIYLDTLTNLFNELFQTLKDNVNLFGVFYRNSVTIESTIEEKVKAFNSPKK